MKLLLPLSDIRTSLYAEHLADMNRIIIPTFKLVHGKLPNEYSTLSEWEQASPDLTLLIWGCHKLPPVILRKLSLGTALCSARRVIRFFYFDRPNDLRPCQALDLIEKCIIDPNCWEATDGDAIKRSANLAARFASYTSAKIAAEIAHDLADVFSRLEFTIATDWCAKSCETLSRSQFAFAQAYCEGRAPSWAADDERMRQRADFIRILTIIEADS